MFVRSFLLRILAIGLTTCGCSMSDMGSSGDFGATQGGVQDMGFARELIDNGQVPPAEAFTVEGMFSEHDLPLAGAACDSTLCLRGAVGIAPTLKGEPSIWLQVGMSSTIDPGNFTRPSLTLIATVDVSGSMGWDYSTQESDYPTPAALARRMLLGVVSQLGPQDRLAIVTYGSDVSTLLPLTQGDQEEAIVNAIAHLSSNGSTNMEAGLKRAYEIAEETPRLTEEVRVMLFTDVQPNVGATSGTEFEQMVKRGANQRIGITVMAVGLGMGQEVLNAMVNLRGGNAFSLFKKEDIVQLMDDSWPWMVSPIAYQLSMGFELPTGLEVAEAFGFPGERKTPGFEVSTVFLSKRRGALLVRLSNEQKTVPTDIRLAGHLAYESAQGTLERQDIQVAYENEHIDERGMFFLQPGTQKAVALAVLVSNMKIAANAYGQDRDTAIGLMEAVVERFSADAQDLNDDSLNSEVDLAKKLLSLMQSHASQGDLYGMR